jgi:hypothetical protein
MTETHTIKHLVVIYNLSFILFYFIFLNIFIDVAYGYHNYFKSHTLDIVILSFSLNSIKFLHFANSKAWRWNRE